MLIQLLAWLAERRVVLEGTSIKVIGVDFDDLMFSPSLDSPEALEFDILGPKAEN